MQFELRKVYLEVRYFLWIFLEVFIWYILSYLLCDRYWIPNSAWMSDLAAFWRFFKLCRAFWIYICILILWLLSFHTACVWTFNKPDYSNTVIPVEIGDRNIFLFISYHFWSYFLFQAPIHKVWLQSKKVPQTSVVAQNNNMYDKVSCLDRVDSVIIFLMLSQTFPIHRDIFQYRPFYVFSTMDCL